MVEFSRVDRRPSRKRMAPDLAIGSDIRNERERQHLTQADLAEKAGLSSDQIVSLIEKGERRLQMEDLVQISEVLHRDFVRRYQYHLGLLKPVKLGPFIKPGREEIVKRFVQDCDNYFEVEKLCDEIQATRLPSPPAKYLTSRDEARDFGDEVREELGLGKYPGESIQRVLEQKCGIKIFSSYDLKDQPAYASGPFGKGILIRRPGESSWEIGQALFYLVTWDPTSQDFLQKDTEAERHQQDLAKAFASALLLPAQEFITTLKRNFEERSLPFATIREAATFFQTSCQAVLWRLVVLNRLMESEIEHFSRKVPPPPVPTRPTSRSINPYDYLPTRFVSLAFRARDRGLIPDDRLTKMLHMDISHLRKILDYRKRSGEVWDFTLELTPSKDWL